MLWQGMPMAYLFDKVHEESLQCCFHNKDEFSKVHRSSAWNFDLNHDSYVSQAYHEIFMALYLLHSLEERHVAWLVFIKTSSYVIKIILVEECPTLH